MSAIGRIRLGKLQVVGFGKPTAEVEFQPGLNAIVGASDTGKSYIFQALNYLLGSSTEPKHNPYSEGYRKCWLELHSAEGRNYSIERVLGEEDINLYETEIAQATIQNVKQRMRASHQTGSTNTLSHFLLEQIKLSGRQVKRNQRGEKNAVTFRDVARLVMIDEGRIISDESPALSGQYLKEPSEKGIFSLFLTGDDDSALTYVAPDKKIRNAALDAKIELFNKLLEEKNNRLQTLAKVPEELEERLQRVSQAVDQGTELVSVARERITELEIERREVWQELQRVRERGIVIGEQLKRLRLLHDYYKTDRVRLDAVVEAGTAFEQLPSGECAVCGRKGGMESLDISTPLEEFHAACRAELEKLSMLAVDLEAAVREFEAEERDLDQKDTALVSRQQSIDAELENQLKPHRRTADASLAQLIQLRADLCRAKDIKDEIAALRVDLQSTENAKKKKIPSVKTSGVDTRIAQDFCQVVADTLRAWKYPFTGTVAFDPTKFDLVIGSQDRGSMGKGYRAITHAAFTISLMRYCRMKSLPHSGFVVIDSPLNPFRGASMKIGPNAPINEEIKQAFYQDLAADGSGDQYIILENTEPPVDLVGKIKYVQFTKTHGIGRYGFFPT